MALLEKHIGNLKWKINANEKSLLFNSTISALMSSGKATFHPLYTMSLDPVLVPAKASYGTMGWHVEDGKDWFLNAYPNKANLAAYEQFWVVRNSSGEVGGFTSTLCEPHSNNQRGRLYVSDLLVHEQFRGQGLAKILLRHVVNRSRAGDGSEDPKFPAIVCLTVFCENIGAVGLYLGEGFRIDESIWVIESL
jgi:ribosomal protein S18 acetylase RimI-like enzyme